MSARGQSHQLQIFSGGKDSFQTTKPFDSLPSSSTQPPCLTVGPNASLGDKLQWMALHRPYAMLVIERVVNELIAKYVPDDASL